MKGTYDCPNCGGAVAFQSSVAVFAVCPFCRSMVVRHDVNIEAIGQMAELPPDLSPLQIGAMGKFDGQPFKLIGRVRIAYDDGSWNEWFAHFDGDRFGWVAETQGFFMVSFDATASGVPNDTDLDVGRTIEIGSRSYQVMDRKETTCLGSEGELPFAAPAGRKARSIDLTGPNAEFAGVEFSDDGSRLFVGRYARFDDLSFSNLRAVPGWSEENLEVTHHQTTSLKCPDCGGTVTLRAVGVTMSATCGSCGALIDTSTPELALIRRTMDRSRIKPQIPLGTRGVLFGVNYEMIGFQHVKDDYSGWQEYLLFNPWQGFAWLVTYNGHWSFVRRLVERPEVSGDELAKAKFEGESYRIFAASNVRTDFVLGEFYWKVKVGMSANVTDFICPPRILSREAYPRSTEQTWSQGEYVEPEIIQTAFNLEAPLREPTGRYLNQPNPYAERGKQLKFLTPLFVAALVLIQIFSSSHAANERVFSANFAYNAGLTNPIAVTEPFELRGRRQAIDVQAGAPVDNNWLELDMDLVNADTQETVTSFEEGIEYYHGYDDGNWSEGSQGSHHLVTAVPPGKYYLTIDAAADANIRELPFTVSVVRDVVAWSNFWISLTLLLVYPLYCLVRSWSFERARWAESDYSPLLYRQGSGDDD